MWEVGAIALGSIVVGAWEAATLWKENKKKETAVFVVLMTVAALLFAAQTMNYSLPNPLDGIAAVFRPVSKALYAVFK
ncbi:hypothetical protein ACF3MZ_18290 [Paenibacillaceae bacterium WGS1546]|uniref:hypothetical protein n=1 Tax=Cohnella sp. WGS1546 TaxID=3366810 RepID=UPI00372D359D